MAETSLIERGAWHHDQVQPPCWWLFGESTRGLQPCLQDCYASFMKRFTGHKEEWALS